MVTNTQTKIITFQELKEMLGLNSINLMSKF